MVGQAEDFPQSLPVVPFNFLLIFNLALFRTTFMLFATKILGLNPPGY